MSIGIRVATIRLLDTRQSFRLGAEHRLETDEWPELATHRFCLPQTEPVDHLIASAPYVRNPRIDYLRSINNRNQRRNQRQAKRRSNSSVLHEKSVLAQVRLEGTCGYLTTLFDRHP